MIHAQRISSRINVLFLSIRVIVVVDIIVEAAVVGWLLLNHKMTATKSNQLTTSLMDTGDIKELLPSALLHN